MIGKTAFTILVMLLLTGIGSVWPGENDDTVKLFRFPIKIEEKENIAFSPFYLEAKTSVFNASDKNLKNGEMSNLSSVYDILDLIKKEDVESLLNRYKGKDSTSSAQEKKKLIFYCKLLSQKIDEKTFVKRKFSVTDNWDLWSVIVEENKHLAIPIFNLNDSYKFVTNVNHPLQFALNTFSNCEAALEQTIQEYKGSEPNHCIDIPYNIDKSNISLCFNITMLKDLNEEIIIAYHKITELVRNGKIDENLHFFGEKSADILKDYIEKRNQSTTPDAFSNLHFSEDNIDFAIKNNKLCFLFYQIGEYEGNNSIYDYHIFYKEDSNYQFINHNYIQGLDQLLKMPEFQRELYLIVENNK